MSFINNFIYSNKVSFRVARHTVFWTADIINYLLVTSINKPIQATDVLQLLLKMPLIILATYFILYYLIPQVSKNRNSGMLLIWGIAVVAFIGVGVRFYNYYIIIPLLDPQQTIPVDVLEYRRVLREILQTMVVVSMAIAIKVIKTDTETRRKNEQLIQEKKVAELNFLKAQMHPHFLFNTLNTLYSDAIQGTGKAEQIVLRLSNLLRFILEECSKPLITIGHEIKVIEDYIALEQLRHGDRLDVRFTQAVEDRDKLISPLLLLPFIENSCKHTLSAQRGHIQIQVDLKAEMDRLTMVVENKLSETTTNNSVSHGMGISNIRKQLQLLYDSNYTLSINSTEGKFVVSLSIPLLTKKVMPEDIGQRLSSKEETSRPYDAKPIAVGHG